MTDPDELRRALLAVATALDALGVRWAVGGSMASTVHGEPRTTNDIDVIAVLDVESARRFGALLGPDFYADRDTAVEAVRRCSSFNVIDQRSFIKIDVFVPESGPLGRGQLDRVQSFDFLGAGRALPVLGPEDTVLQKLRWYRSGGEVSDRQWRDIVSVLRASRDELDFAYLATTAETAGLALLLSRARQAAEP